MVMKLVNDFVYSVKWRSPRTEWGRQQVGQICPVPEQHAFHRQATRQSVNNITRFSTMDSCGGEGVETAVFRSGQHNSAQFTECVDIRFLNGEFWGMSRQ